MANNNNNRAFLAARTRFTGTMNRETVATPPSSEGGDASGLRKVLSDACTCFKKAVNSKDNGGGELGSDAATVVDSASYTKWAEVNVGDVVVGFEYPLDGRAAKAAELLGSNGLRGFSMSGYEERNKGKWDVELTVVNHVGVGGEVDTRGEKWTKGEIIELKNVSGCVMTGKDEGWLKIAALEGLDEVDRPDKDGPMDDEPSKGKRSRSDDEDGSKRSRVETLLKTEGKDFNGNVWSVNDGSGKESVAKLQLILRCWSVKRVISVFNESIKWSMDVFMEAVRMESCRSGRRSFGNSSSDCVIVDNEANFARVTELSEYPIMHQQEVLEKFMLGEVSVTSEKVIGLRSFVKSGNRTLPPWEKGCSMPGRSGIAECLSTWCHVMEVFLVGGMSKTCQFMVDQLMSHQSCFQFVSDFVIGKEIWLVLATCMIDLKRNREVGAPGGRLDTPNAIRAWFAFNLQGLIDAVAVHVPDQWQYDHYKSKLLPFSFINGMSSASGGGIKADTVANGGLCAFHLGGLLDLKNKKGEPLVCMFKPCKGKHFTSLGEYPEEDLKKFTKGEKAAAFIKEAVKKYLLDK